MDALDAGVYAYVYEADVPRSLKVVLWGPLHAKELGFGEWSYQDGGETGFIYHATGRALRLGLASATLTVVRRTGKAYLSVYVGGYPSDAPVEQRRLDVQSIATEAELFLTRLAKETIRFQAPREWTLVEPTMAEAQATTAAVRKRL